MAVQLYQGAYGQNAVTYNTAFFDFTDGTAGVDYTEPTVTAATLPTTGESVSVCVFDVPLAGMDRLTDFATDPASPQNLGTQPRAAIYQEAGAWIIDTLPDAEALPIGSQKPDDWDLHYLDRYYTRVSVQYAGATVYSYNAATATYNPATQYYVQDSMQCIYYTGGQGFFGISRGYRTYNPVSSTVFAEMVCTLRRIGSPGSTPIGFTDPYIWRSGGAFASELVTYARSGAQIRAIGVSPALIDGEMLGKSLLQLVEFEYGDVRYIGIVDIQLSADSIPQSAHITGVSLPFWIGEAQRPNYGRASGISYGQGTFSDPSQPVGIPGIPAQITATDFGAGMHIRTLSQENALPQLMAQLWGTGSFWSAWKNIRFDPLSCIVSMHVIPWQILPSVSFSQLSIALTKLDVPNGRPPSRVVDIPRGTVSIPEYYGSRLDYAPHTSANIYLPFIGDYPLDISDIMGGSLSLTYRVDIATGDCIAFLLGTDRRGLTTISKSYRGNCAWRIPVSGSDNGGAGMLSALSSLVGGAVSIATGNVVGGAGQMLGGAWTAATTPIHTTAPQVQGSASAMGVLTPYVKIYRDVQARPEGYDILTGDTAAIGGTVAIADMYNVSGFTVFDDVKLDIDATDAEKAEIMQLLRAGVYL